MSKKSDFIKCHGYKLIVIAAMLFFDILNLHYTLNKDFERDYNWVLPYPPSNFFVSYLVLNILMFIPPLVMLIHVIRHRSDPFVGYGDWSDPIIAVLKAIGFIAGFAFAYFVIFVLFVILPNSILAGGVKG